MNSGRRVLGVIRPTAEVVGHFSRTGEIGILATPGTVSSGSYPIEISKFFPDLKVHQQACPMWVPLIENNEHETSGADFFVNKCVNGLLSKSPGIDTILLACTHYPLLQEKIAKAAGKPVKVVSQGEIVAESLVDYLDRHPLMEQKLRKNRLRKFFTTDSAEEFDRHATSFFGDHVESQHIHL
jgi:glutamate racemase